MTIHMTVAPKKPLSAKFFVLYGLLVAFAAVMVALPQLLFTA